jgi:putative RecB family exonuclease
VSTELLIDDQPRGRQGGIWAYVSPSRLSKWLSCPLAFRLQYVDGHRPPTTPSLFLGKTVHAALQVFYRHRHLGITLDAADVCCRALESWARLVDEANMKFDSPAEEQAIQKQGADLVMAYLGCVPKDEKPLAVEAAVEMPLIDPATGEDLGIPLLGIMDLVLDDQAGPIIVDFKTTSRSSEASEITHEIQLSSYAYLFREVSDRPEAGLEIRSLIKTKSPKVEIHRYPPRTDGHFRRLFAVIREYLDVLDRNQFNFRPGWGCGMCDFRNSHCRNWLS